MEAEDAVEYELCHPADGGLHLGRRPLHPPAVDPVEHRQRGEDEERHQGQPDVDDNPADLFLEDGYVDLSDVSWLDAPALIVFWALMLIVMLQFFTRYVLNDSLGWTEEIARYLLIFVTFIGAITCTRLGAHIFLEFFYRYLPRWMIKPVTVIVEIINTLNIFNIFGLRRSAICITISRRSDLCNAICTTSTTPVRPIRAKIKCENIFGRCRPAE